MTELAQTPTAAERKKGVQEPLPARAQVVVVGAGVIGCSVARYLTKMGCRDVLILERKSVGCGTSWHSHGIVGLVRASPTLLRMALETARMLPELEQETDKSTGYAERGSINVTTDPSRMIQFRRFADVAKAAGLPIEVVDGAEAKRLWPHLNADDLIGGIHLPTEGQCNPLDLTQALVASARKGGARLAEGVAVTDVDLDGGRIVAVETTEGRVECETVVNCTGLWGRDFLRGKTGGLPLQAVEHGYIVTDFSKDVIEGLPILRDPDMVMTVRQDSQQLSFGFNEREAKLFAEDSVPEAFEFDQLPPDWDAAMPYIEEAARRVPILNELGIRLFLCGPESATPDTRYLLGPVGPIPNYYVAAGFSGIGIGSSGGAGRALAHWVLNDAPPDDLWDVDVQRMMPYQANRTYIMCRAREANGQLFAMNWPHRQNRSARGVRRSPLHEAMVRARACFAEVAGWEVPEWFAPEGVDPMPNYSFERPAWFPYATAEARAALDSVALADRSAIGKFLVFGPDAETAVRGLGSNDPTLTHDGPTRMPVLNDQGGIEALFTVIDLDGEGFLLLSEAQTQARDLTLLRRRLANKGAVNVIDATSAHAVIDVVGPRSEETLRRAGWRGSRDSSLGSDRAAEIGFANTILFREDRLSVPAWTVVVPTEFAAGVFEALIDADATASIRPIGRHACQSLLTVSRSPTWSQGLTTLHSPLEAGLHGLVDLSGDRRFPGRDVCARQLADGVTKRLAAILPDDDDAVLLGHEPVYVDGRLAGAIDQAAYALASDRATGLGYITLAQAIETKSACSGHCEILVAGQRVGGRFESTVGFGSAAASNAPSERQAGTVA